RENEKKHGQSYTVSVYYFGHDVTRDHFGAKTGELKDMRDYEYPVHGNSTKLRDGVGRALVELDELPAEADTAFLVQVVTDGQENASKIYSDAEIKKLFELRQKTERWTIAFQVPPLGKRHIEKLGIPTDNIFEWKPTAEGIKTATVGTQTALDGYFAQ